MKKDFSYWIVPIYVNERWEKEFLVIHQKTKNWSFWWFPKWHAEKWETELESAKRELFEEVWIKKIDIDAWKSFQIQYVFKENEEIINKTAKYWIGYVKNKNIKIQNEELNWSEWLNLDATLNKLSHRNIQNRIKEIFNKN